MIIGSNFSAALLFHSGSFAARTLWFRRFVTFRLALSGFRSFHDADARDFARGRVMYRWTNQMLETDLELHLRVESHLLCSNDGSVRPPVDDLVCKSTC